jgi:hypothetical protein
MKDAVRKDVCVVGMPLPSEVNKDSRRQQNKITNPEKCISTVWYIQLGDHELASED